MLLKCHKLWRTPEPSPREFQPNYPWSNEEACYRLRVSSFLQACISLAFKRAADKSGQVLSFKLLFEWLVQATIEWLKNWSQPSWCYSDINVRRRRRLFTCSVRWSPKESHTRRNFSLEGTTRQTMVDPLLNTFLVHPSFLLERNLHKLGTESGLSAFAILWKRL